ncbi:MAG: putative lipid II flippase FtsW [Actinomycetota bacterium]
MTVISIAKQGRRGALRARMDLPAGARSVTYAAGGLTAFGLLMVLSASWVESLDKGQSAFFFLTRQSLGAIIGIVAMFVFALIPVQRLKNLAIPALVLAILGLLLVLTPLGLDVNGSKRWIAIGGFTIQPSELAKLAFILAGGAIVAKKGSRLITIGDAMRPMGLLLLVLAALVMAEPDLGTATILGLLFMVMLFVAGTPARTLTTFTLMGSSAFAFFAMSADYRRARVFSFLDPFADPENTGYQAVQGIVALGSGGIFGNGIGMSRQKWLYVPNAHTDFIYAVIGEELGLIGTLGILGLFVWLTIAGLRIAGGTKDPFARCLAAGITVWLTSQALINIGAVTSVLPITGVPLPFVSYGNSALIVSLAAVGILMSIARENAAKESRSA